MVITRRTVFISAIFLVCIVAAYESLAHIQDVARRASCRPYLLVRWPCNEYAAAHDGQYPPLSPIPGMFYPDPVICKDFTCPKSGNLCEFDRHGTDAAFNQLMYDHPWNDWSYVYLGYFIENEDQFLAFAQAYRETIARDGDFQDALHVGDGKGFEGGPTLPRLKSHEWLQINRDPIAERAHEIPVVIEWPENHRNPGGHVVYLDGHREFVDYPGKFPMTRAVIAELRALDNYAPRYF